MWLNICRAYIGLRFLDLVIIWSGVMSITSQITRNTSPHVVGLSLMSVLGLTISCLSNRTSRSWFILFSTTNYQQSQSLYFLFEVVYFLVMACHINSFIVNLSM